MIWEYEYTYAQPTLTTEETKGPLFVLVQKLEFQTKEEVYIFPRAHNYIERTGTINVAQIDAINLYEDLAPFLIEQPKSRIQVKETEAPTGENGMRSIHNDIGKEARKVEHEKADADIRNDLVSEGISKN